MFATLHCKSTLIKNLHTRVGSWREIWSCRVVTSKLINAKLFAWKLAHAYSSGVCPFKRWGPLSQHLVLTEWACKAWGPYRFIATVITLFCKSDFVAETVSLGSGEKDGRLLTSPHPSAGGVLPTTPECFRNSLCCCSFCSFTGVWRHTRSNCKAKGNTHIQTQEELMHYSYTHTM